MSIEQWSTIRHTRGFYVRTYRWMCLVLVGLNILFLCLSIICSYCYLTRGQSSFYATSGETLPVKLNPMTHPNDSSTPLLASDVALTAKKSVR